MKNGIFKVGKNQFDLLQKAQQYRNTIQTNYQTRNNEAVTSIETGASINDHNTKTIITDQDTTAVATAQQKTTSQLKPDTMVGRESANGKRIKTNTGVMGLSAEKTSTTMIENVSTQPPLKKQEQFQ